MGSPAKNDFSSPKRKRIEDAAAPPLQTSLVPRFPPTRSEHDGGEDSPRTHVAGRFQALELDPSDCRQLDDVHEREYKRIAHSAESEDLPDSSPCPAINIEQQTDGASDSSEALWPSAPSFTFQHTDTLAPPTADKRPKSPSLSGEISEQYWHESEITGHDPDDPTDDGYGINGIGFRPTPAIAFARSQKRKQQLAEYRSRETRDARQKRSERRRGGSGEMSSMASASEDTSKSKVRFDDG